MGRKNLAGRKFTRRVDWIEEQKQVSESKEQILTAVNSQDSIHTERIEEVQKISYSMIH